MRILPRVVGRKYITELQSMLLEDDCFLPKFRRKMPKLTEKAVLTAEYGDASVLQNGINRKIRVMIMDTGEFATERSPIFFRKKLM